MLAAICEPSFYDRLMKAWASLKESTENYEARIELLNAKQNGRDNYFKLNAVSSQIHHGVYLDRYENVRNGTQLESTDGLRFYYRQESPSKGYVQQNALSVLRVETDLKLNLVLERQGETLKLIDDSDSEKVSKRESHFMMIDGLMSQGPPGIMGNLMMQWKFATRQFNIKNWIVSDFDHFMGGNPHDLKGM